MKLKVRHTIISILLLLAATAVQAQITIGGNVYGGGNAGDMGGRTTVTVYGGTVKGSVFGGARQAHVGGSSFVHIDGSKMTDDIIVKSVYGGNDISGTVGTSSTLPDLHRPSLVNDSYNAFVRTSQERKETAAESDEENAEEKQQYHIFIGSLFGGGNGDYKYQDDDGLDLQDEDSLYLAQEKQADGTYNTIATSTEPFTKPVQDNVYLEIMGGTIAYVYGGGNNATVAQKADIYINNHSEVATRLPSGLADAEDDEEHNLLRQTEWLESMGIAVIGENAVRDTYHFSRVFGGNNKADMHIHPTWHLVAGHIENLYSGGNEGRMTSSSGLLLEIDPQVEDIPASLAEPDDIAAYRENAKKDLMIDNVYGGCRKADVRPLDDDGNEVGAGVLSGYAFPEDFSARVIVRGGDINNVYGGNDISGHVAGGNAVGVYSSIRGNIYGGGNGSYPYTDNSVLSSTLKYGDYYYDAKRKTGKESLELLNAHRPDAEQVSIYVKGDSESKKTVIGGAIYVGGNSATLRSERTSPLVELKVGSYVIADEVYLGNNGKELVRYGNATDALEIYKNTKASNGTDYASFDLTDSVQFAEYMEAAAMSLKPTITFDAEYVPYSTWFGSFYCGGNVGSMTYPGTREMDFNVPVIVYSKIVGGCNDAYVPETSKNARYKGGIRGSSDEQNGFADADGKIKDRLVLNFTSSAKGGVQIKPMRWKTDGNGNRQLELNTVDADGNPTPPLSPETYNPSVKSTFYDLTRRFDGGNVYGGCHNSGYVNGNVVINLENDLVDRNSLFDVVEEDEIGEAIYYTNDNYKITERRTGVILGQQGMDVLGKALNVFGGGKGEDTQIWGSTTINLKSGYTFQIFGGSQEGIIGAPYKEGDPTDGEALKFRGETFRYNPAYSCTINVHGTVEGNSKKAYTHSDMADCEFIYGGGFEGPVVGNTTINLGNGRVFNTFAGSCNADILGHTETYIGRSGRVDEDGNSVLGFPWIRDYVYGGNDLGGHIRGTGNFKERVRTAQNEGDFDALSKVYGYEDGTDDGSDVLNASAYIEYTQGRAVGIFGGCYGSYDYTDAKFDAYTYTATRTVDEETKTETITYSKGADENNLGSAKGDFTKPFMDNVFVNFRPEVTNTKNSLQYIFGAGQGYSGEKEMNCMQNRSYVLIDIPQNYTYFNNMEVFGGGSWGGVGMKGTPSEAKAAPDKYSAVIDLMRGQIGSVYGASFKEGFTRRTMVNVPRGSTIALNSIFGGGYGLLEEDEDDAGNVVMLPRNDVSCDAYEAHVNYHSSDAVVKVRKKKILDKAGNEVEVVESGGIYGGNNACRRTLYSKVDIDVPVYANSDKTEYSTVFGAGYGKDTWSQYVEVNLLKGARVDEVYGGGLDGKVLNKESVTAWKGKNTSLYTDLENGYEDFGIAQDDAGKAMEDLVKIAENDSAYNTNIYIMEGATVNRYSFGGGLGNEATSSGTTYITLQGGTAGKDIYGGGWGGSVMDEFGGKTFTASANVYIKGGSVRNVYGGSYQGSVGYHDDTADDATDDIPGETHVVIGKFDGTTNADGVPAIKRSAYGGGEQGAVYGSTDIKIYNGRIGYYYNGLDEDGEMDFQPELNDPNSGDPGIGKLDTNGNAFGAGYGEGASVDDANIWVYGGKIRGSLFGGGEIAAVGRGKVEEKGEDNRIRLLQEIYQAGKTHVYFYDGHVLRNIFGGGRGYDTWGKNGQRYFTDGYVFGQTEVNVYGGEVGTEEGMERGFGNVFGGGDVGFVYSAYDGGRGLKSGSRYDGSLEGYYYRATGVDDDGNPIWETGEKELTEDCKVLVEPHCLVTAAGGVDIDNLVTAADGVDIDNHYDAGTYVPTSALNTLRDKTSDEGRWGSLDAKGIIIHNAVFAGGNATVGSSDQYADATTVFGNATASIHDVYHRDLITIGTGHTGGLYGDGNLTFVDGYRGLNITNYGTDFYNISMEISIDDYHKLSEREAAYYELRFKCIRECEDINKKVYRPENVDIERKASTITTDELLTLFNGVMSDVYEQDEDGTWKLVYDDDGNPRQTPMVDANGKPNPAYWEENGVCSRYAGRIMNTIQRADFCGVFGSRMVMQGARDRVTKVENTTNFTINRVREVSLNKKESVAGDDPTSDAYRHGNYFGIYSIVNFLGALTSDVNFGASDMAERVTTNSDAAYIPDSEGQTFYDWKLSHKDDRKRNNGTSYNKVALASGVYLELTTEKNEGATEVEDKDWGPITGVIELDLINVQTGVGGGFVYAKNEHGKPHYAKNVHATLTALNREAVTHRDFYYDTDDADLEEWETSGNFVHSTQTIIDDCYPISMRYKSTNAVKAHYWYIKGQVYVYDKEIKAYTGSSNAYTEAVDLPLTITAASNGTMRLISVKPNLYAYYTTDADNNRVKLDKDAKLEIGEKKWALNEPISYWEWHLMSAKEQALFVPETYVTISPCTFSYTKDGKTEEKTYEAGEVLLAEEYADLREHAATKNLNPDDAESVEEPYVEIPNTSTGSSDESDDESDDEVAATKEVAFDYVFRSSNNMSHDTGYMLTFDMNNPGNWDKWHTLITGNPYDDKIDATTFAAMGKADQLNYENGPTYTPRESRIYGQYDYKEGNLISQHVYWSYEGNPANQTDYPGIDKTKIPEEQKENQAKFESAYVVTRKVDTRKKTADGDYEPQTLYVGASVVESYYDESDWTAMAASLAPAFICTNTIELVKEGYQTAYIFVNTVMTEAEKNQYMQDYPDQVASIESLVQPAYYCTKSGLYGGSYYQEGHNYRGLDIWSSMSKEDRDMFTFNYDAFDLLIDPTYSAGIADGELYHYDGKGFSTLDEAKRNKAGYSVTQYVDYTATYNGTELNLDKEVIVTRKDAEGKDVSVSTSQILPEDELNREAFESLPNEQRHYAPITVQLNKEDDDPVKVYVVNTTFIRGETPYAAGQTVSRETYNSFSSDDADSQKIDVLEFSASEVKESSNYSEANRNATFYYCRETYTITSDGHAVKSIKGEQAGTTFSGAETTIPAGIVIEAEANSSEAGYAGYSGLENKQLDFTIHGISPRAWSTLYVNHESNIYDLSTDKIITVVYQYDYTESDVTGMHITPVSERHVVNLHIQFESGAPTVPDITKPAMVIPGTLVGLSDPVPTPGHYKVTGGGWKMFETKRDAESHTNGVDFKPNRDQLYWYQDGYWVAYYALTYLGETYSNSVQLSVANYHDLKEVMDDKEHHMYVDNPNVHRDSKIYLNDYSLHGQNGVDLLKDFYDLSVRTTAPETGDRLAGHALLDDHVKAGQNLDFILRSNQDCTSSSTAWEPIAATGDCFAGTLHGDGYTVKGLTKSLFGNLCGKVYNLGVTGSFTGAGIAEQGKGYVENCWVSTTSTAAKTAKPVFGNPQRTAEEGAVQLVNCYYEEEDGATNPYTNHTESDGHGVPMRMTARQFRAGEVAYNLNGFYLYKRYSDHQSSGTSGQYPFFTVDADNGLVPHVEDEATHYGSDPLLSSAGDTDSYSSGGYVESRFADGDFRFAAGYIPGSEEREHVSDGRKHYYPIWPDDFMFFGQHLNYGYLRGSHDEQPTHLLHDGNRIVANSDGDGNRVYRAPAYFRSNKMQAVYFNPNAVFVSAEEKKNDEENDPTIPVHTGLTAIDFTGGNGDLTGGYQKGQHMVGGSARFYPPLLDNGNGLSSFDVYGLTRNLLVYSNVTDANTEAAVAQSMTLADQSYTARSSHHTTMVDFSDPGRVSGHRVQLLSNGTYVAPNDHFLIDREDFNAPIGYQFASGKRMWHQRQPDPDRYPDDTYVSLTDGWQGISLPFTAELVTTDQKGEITHFYSGSKTVDGSEAKIGHEYWLREYCDISEVAADKKAEAVFDFPELVTSFTVDGETVGADKTVGNTFLWDYYYDGNHSHKDGNGDVYQDADKNKEYYDSVRVYEKYPYLHKATPYIIGFPGPTYYEFDLSGEWTASSTASTAPSKLRRQTITFVSAAGAKIGVSDDETEGVTHNSYTFKPSYISMDVPVGSYLLNAAGSAYERTAEVKRVAPFRPYFVGPVSSPSPGRTRSVAESIVFDSNGSSFAVNDDDPSSGELGGELTFATKRLKLVVSSSLKRATDVRVFSTSGMSVASFTIQPGDIVETDIPVAGVYIVRAANGHYTKKLVIKY